jgi:23S rRNA (guanine2445-N2)-methyltransferase / 23S rRNA (guanine2069-N7)-methyltransferase
MRFIATCASGLEGLTAAEIDQWGGKEIVQANGSVQWTGSLESGYRACLWSRFSSRILLTINEVNVATTDDLYEQARAQNWQDHLDVDNSFSVDGTCAQGSPVTHSKFAALRIKDGVVDQFREKMNQRPNVEVSRPDVRLNIHVGTERSILSIDLSGEGLNRRGYRSAGGQAPLKETLAAAIVALSGWAGDEPLLDPMCGSGTILIEAALMAGDSAPGLGRSYYGLTNWKGHDETLWATLVSEAIDREQQGQHKKWPGLTGYDADSTVIGFARENIRRAGLETKIKVSTQELFSLKATASKGCLICNPPYGERLSEQESVKYLYRCLGNRLQESFQGWKIGLFTMKPEFADHLQIPWKQSHRLRNGPLACRLYSGSPGSPTSFSWKLPESESDEKGGDFANRLRKNFRKIHTWATKNDIECFRLYDRDLPEYNVSVDLFGKRVLIREFPPPTDMDQSTAQDRFNTVLGVVRSVLGVGRDRVFILRSKRKTEQPERNRKIRQPRLYEVRENGCSYLVNFSGAYDAGLVLAQRLLREKVAGQAGDKEFLNLFGHTGTASVSAALGGAARTTTVEPSAHYLQWSEKNFSLNGMYPDHHQLVQEDCLEWLKKQDSSYDLIYAGLQKSTYYSDNTRVFDTKKQHGMLVRLAMSRLNQSGVFYFATTTRSFQLDKELEENYICQNNSGHLIPKDFERHRQLYQFWEIRHKNELSGS